MANSIRKWAIVPKGENWRERLAQHKAWWSQRNLDDIHQAIEDDVFRRATSAETLPAIARTYGVPQTDFDSAYGDVWRLGHSQMQTDIRQHTLAFGMQSSIPVAKIWMGKSLGGLTDGGFTVNADGEASDDGSVHINVNVIRKPPMEDQGGD